MACPFCRLRAWSRRKTRSSSEPWPRKTSLARVLSHRRRDHELPPPYLIPSPKPTAESEIVEPLVSRDPSRAQMPVDVGMPTPPPPMPTLRGAADAAAECATLGMLHALAGERPEVVAVRAVQAMAVATSTSRAYTTFLAASAAAESVASICAEDPIGCANWPSELVARRVQNAYTAALDRARGPKAANNARPLVFDDDFDLSSTRPRESSHTSRECQNAVQGLTSNLVTFLCQQPI